jgi:hypothetical protein
MFRIESRQLTDVLETAGYIFEQAAFAVLVVGSQCSLLTPLLQGSAPEVLMSELTTVGMKVRCAPVRTAALPTDLLSRGNGRLPLWKCGQALGPTCALH